MYELAAACPYQSTCKTIDHRNSINAGFQYDAGVVYCCCFVFLSLLASNFGTLFVKRRTGFLPYVEDPKVKNRS